MYRNFKIVPNIIFGRGSFNQLGDILRSKRQGNNSQMVFVLDDVFSGKELEKKLPLETNDLLSDKKPGLGSNQYQFFVSDAAEKFRNFANSILKYGILSAKTINIEQY